MFASVYKYVSETLEVITILQEVMQKLTTFRLPVHTQQDYIYIVHVYMPAHIQILPSTHLVFIDLPSSSSVAPGLATNTGSEGLQPSSCHTFVSFVLVSSFSSY